MKKAVYAYITNDLENLELSFTMKSIKSLWLSGWLYLELNLRSVLFNENFADLKWLQD